MSKREVWGTRIGLILAMAGNAIGLGNFLRFPVQAAKNGGGAFMIPYIIALLLLGIPLMWLEWSMGRFGGQFGHGTTPGMFDRLWNHRLAKYFGSLGISIPLLFVIYYVYIESWTLGYSFFSITKAYFGFEEMGTMKKFLEDYQGISQNAPFSMVLYSFLFFLITLGINVYVISRGISGGVEKLAKIAMPLLFIFAIILVVRVFTLGTPDPSKPENNVINGLAFVWNPDFSRLSESAVWLAAAGQIFFTLSIGSGAIQTYASYLKKNEDVVLTGLTTSMTNEFAEVVCGGSIAIPIATAFFGIAITQEIAQEGAFNLGFVAMPIIFTKLPIGFFFGMLWFLLLFFAGITSSVALTQPLMAFLQDELHVKRPTAAMLTGSILLIFGLPVVFFLSYGYLDQYDFWIGTVFLCFFALMETIIFAWVYKGNFWEEITRSAELSVPKIFYYIIKFVVPLYLSILFVSWIYQDLTSPHSKILLRGVENEKLPYLWFARFTIFAVMLSIAVLVKAAWERKRKRKITSLEAL